MFIFHTACSAKIFYVGKEETKHRTDDSMEVEAIALFSILFSWYYFVSLPMIFQAKSVYSS